MARYESEGTWFDPKLAAERERKARPTIEDVGRLLEWHKATGEAVPSAQAAAYFVRMLEAHGCGGSAEHIRGVYRLPPRW